MPNHCSCCFFALESISFERTPVNVSMLIMYNKGILALLCFGSYSYHIPPFSCVFKMGKSFFKCVANAFIRPNKYFHYLLKHNFLRFAHFLCLLAMGYSSLCDTHIQLVYAIKIIPNDCMRDCLIPMH